VSHNVCASHSVRMSLSICGSLSVSKNYLKEDNLGPVDQVAAGNFS